MYRVIRIKDTKLFLRVIFYGGDVNLTATNPMLYTENKYIEQDIEKLKQYGIEGEVKFYNPESKTIIQK